MIHVAHADKAESTTCPLCGGRNECGVGEGSSECWCFAMSIPTVVRERIPEDSRAIACVCRSCAGRELNCRR